MSRLSIAVVTETLVQRYYVKHAVEESGYRVQENFVIADVIASYNSGHPIGIFADAWVVMVDVERLNGAHQETCFQEWLYSLNQPVIFSESNIHNTAEHDCLSWVRQLKVKLLNLEGQIQLADKANVKAEYVWVLAASTGGPDAVKRFLDALDINLGVGFIYAQHIDANQCDTLAKNIVLNNHYEARVASHGDIVTSNQVLLISPRCLMELEQNGSLISRNDIQWRGMYKPSIDQVVANVATTYGCRSGVIFFTGMGEDGVAACRLMSLRGGQVWSQALSDCVATSMPDEVIKTGYVNKIDSPENLALHLKKFIHDSRSEVV